MTDQELNERVRAVVESPLAAEGFEVVDVEQQGTVLRVTVDLLVGSETAEPLVIDLDGVTRATQVVSDLLDAHDLVGARTMLEVSSPGLERALRTPEHFRRFVGSEVAVKLRPGADGERRVAGVLAAADDTGVVVGGRRLVYGDIDKARTVFVWPAGGQKRPAGKTARKPGPKRIGTAS